MLRVVCCFLLLVACASRKEEPTSSPTSTVLIAAKDPGDFRVVTYNVKKGNPIEPIIEELRAQNADIILLQEIDDKTSRSGYVDQTQVLAKALSMNAFYSPSYEEFEGKTGQAILSRFPLRDGQIVDLENSRNIAAAATIEVEGVSIRFFSVHLSSNMKKLGEMVPESLEARAREATRIAELARQAGDWVIVGGDFNTSPSTEPYNILSTFLQDVGTKEATLPAAFPMFSFDHVMASKELEGHKAFVGPLGVSDHRMVIVDLKLPQKQ
jgi:endonuclease/exonuclease/phosphatase family metal-dependent hydrolase